MREFSQREVSPYFTKPKDCALQNRLQAISQSIKKKASGNDSGKRTKTDVISSNGLGTNRPCGLSSGNDADDDQGYVTAADQQQRVDEV